MAHPRGEWKDQQRRKHIDGDDGSVLGDTINTDIDENRSLGDTVVFRMRRKREGLRDADTDSLEDSFNCGGGGDTWIRDDSEPRFRRRRRC